jgi:hypothetical protein
MRIFYKLVFGFTLLLHSNVAFGAVCPDKCSENKYCDTPANGCDDCPTSHPKSPVDTVPKTSCYKTCAACTTTGTTGNPNCSPTTAGTANHPDDCIDYGCNCDSGYTPNGGGTNPNCSCTPNTYNVKINLNDGTSPEYSGPTCTYGTECDLGALPTRSGHTFGRWVYAQGLTLYFDSSNNIKATTKIPATFDYPPAHDADMVILVEWEQCANGAGVATWGGECVAATCKGGYELQNNTSQCGGSGTSYAINKYNCCKSCAESGKYCPAGGV